MASQRAFIDEIRRKKFKIGSPHTKPLAPDLHRAITHLSTDQYQNDMHFVKEIIQNAEDNTYAADVCPSLEFLLTNEDVVGVGVSATLLVLNNKSGMTCRDVQALCSVEDSTKKGRRNKGFIGSKGVGFKSVFMVCQRPTIISNGFRICFQDAPSEAGVGYIVPKWTESPTDEAILSASGRDELPTTVIVLPLRSDKVDLVRSQLNNISPENILFLSKIRELNVVDMTHKLGHASSLLISRSAPMSVRQFSIPLGKSNVTYEIFKVTLRVECGQGSDTFCYIACKGLFPVTHPTVERLEVHDWAISLAFPQEGRASLGHCGDVFSFLPTELRTGFPFIINADFILTTSRESIRFDTQWNVGILDLIPVVFEAAFAKMVQPSDYLPDRRDVYKFLPVSSVDNAYRYCSTGSGERELRQKIQVQPHLAWNIHQLEKVRTDIFKKLREQKFIFLSSPGVDNSLQLAVESDLPATSCLQMKASFCEVLKSAAQSKHPATISAVLKLPDGPESSNRKWYGIVDEYVQDNYAAALAVLDVSTMTEAQYKSFILDSDWLINLPDKIYLQVLGFVAFEMKLLDKSSGKSLQLFKIRVQNGGVELVSSRDLQGRYMYGGGYGRCDMLHIPSVGDAEWIYKWVKEFSQWDSVKVLPTGTSQALKEACNRGALMHWMKKHFFLSESDVTGYATRLIQKLDIINIQQNLKFSALVLQFLYSGIRFNKLSKAFVVHSIQNRDRRFRGEEKGGILLPRLVSRWPILFDMSHTANFKHLVVLSNSYLVPQCSLVQNIVTQSPGQDSMLQFIEEAFNAVDLPSIKLQDDECLLPFYKPVTMRMSVLLMQWLKVLIPNRKLTKLQHATDPFVASLRGLAWVKTYHHGWRRPASTFFSVNYFGNYFTARDLPFLDVNAYAPLHLSDSESQKVFEEVGVVTSLRKKCAAAVVRYFSRVTAANVDLEVAKRFYIFFREIDIRDQADGVKIWIPACGTSEVPMWRDPAECIISDVHSIFKGNGNVTVLDKIYDAGLLAFFTEVLQVPEKPPIATYCEIWLEWSRACDALCKVKEEDGCLQSSATISRAKVECVLKEIFHNWQDSSEEAAEVWQRFLSLAWVPVAPKSNESISFVVPRKALIADDAANDMELQYFSAIADGTINFVWLLPGISSEEVADPVTMSLEMGVKKLSESVTSDVHIPPKAWRRNVPKGKGLLCEGLFRTVLAYLCKLGLSFDDRQQIVKGLIAVIEVKVREPFEKSFSLHVDTSASPTTFKSPNVLVHYDKCKGRLYYLKTDHTLLQGDGCKWTFNSEFVTTVSAGILSEYPELVQGLTVLLKLLFESGFATEAVECEFKQQNLSICPDDEKWLTKSFVVSKRRSSGRKSM